MEDYIATINGEAISPSKPQIVNDEVDSILDSNWAKTAFLLPDNMYSDKDIIRNRYWTSASASFVDSRLGANIGINARPQFTRYADVREKGRLTGRNDVSPTHTTGNYGVGNYYMEAINDPAQIVYLRFGVPEFNSLTNFLSKAFDTEQSSIVRTGRTSIWFSLGKLVGAAAVWVAFPRVSAIVAAGRMATAVFSRPTSKFYVMKPTMYQYWSMVNTLVNTIAINIGFMPLMEKEQGQRVGQPFKMDADYIKQLSGLAPDIISKDGYIDCYAMCNKGQRIANQLFASDYDRLNRGTPTNYTGFIKSNMSDDPRNATYISDKNGNPSFSQALDRALRLSKYFGNSSPDKAPTEVTPTAEVTGDGTNPDKSWVGSFAEYFDAEFRDGAGFAVFKVDHTGQSQESFSTSVVESDISQKLNGASANARETRFSFADGNISELLGGILGGVADIAKGVISSASFGFGDLMMGLAGEGFIDIPKHWQSSSVSLPRASYTMTLISPYDNPMSRLQNIYIPLAMILAGIMPRSIGKQSYASPLLCQCFDRGRVQIRTGIMDSVSLNRGTSNLPFDLKGNALAIDVSFSVVDLSSIMHMPISSGSMFEKDMTLDEDNILMDYLAVLAGQDIYSQIYPLSKAKLNLAKMLIPYRRFTSSAYWSATIHDSVSNGILRFTPFAVLNGIEAVARGNDMLNRSPN